MKASLAWERLLIEGRKIVTSGKLRELAKELSKDEEQLIDYLRRHGYIDRILRGYFYVKSLEERKRNTYENPLFNRVAMALKAKGVTNWYFALETALKLNLMTHEYFYIDYVITDSYRTTKVITIGGQNFHFIKRSLKHFKNGIIHKNRLRYSDPEKTVLDLAYRDYLKSKEKELYLASIMEFLESIDRNKIKSSLKPYPKKFREVVEAFL